ncbi:MAG: UDP-N-acetylmuramate dehydrogenase [Acidimicrobiaceae bacterium]|nr:UDP-N-acetylmuramate dehydrogenase [Acidimicrobiaceae bacterium]
MASGKVDPSALALAVEALGERALPGEPIGPLTTYRVGGTAAVAVRVLDEDDLEAVARARRVSALPVLVIGRGSNLLVSDAGFDGIAVILDPDAYGEVTVDGTSVTAAAAVPLPALARRSADAGLTGLEWAVGVPGSVGGAVRMNAGGHGSDTAHHLRHARVADLDHDEGRPLVCVRPAAALELGYRRSALAATDVVLDATFHLAPGDVEQSRAQIREIVHWRREHQPGGQNAGSVFTNPGGPGPEGSAGWLIEQAGLKGFRHGTAVVSPKHANFIQAEPGGSADDVAALIAEVAERVAARSGVELHTEVRMVGFRSAPVCAESQCQRQV